MIAAKVTARTSAGVKTRSIGVAAMPARQHRKGRHEEGDLGAQPTAIEARDPYGYAPP
jgi:hypothetical protein